MEHRVSTTRLGHDLTLKIPPAIAEELGLGPDSSVDVSVLGNSIVVCPTNSGPRLLDELLSGITDDNLHGETDTGPTVGKEVV